MTDIDYIKKYIFHNHLSRDNILNQNSLEYLDNIVNESKGESINFLNNELNTNTVLKDLTKLYLNKTLLNIDINESEYKLLLTRTINRFHKQKTTLDEDEYKENDVVNIEKLRNYLVQILSGIFILELITSSYNPTLTFQFNNDYIYKGYFNRDYIFQGEGFASTMIDVHTRGSNLSGRMLNRIFNIVLGNYYLNEGLVHINNSIYHNANNIENGMGNVSMQLSDFSHSLNYVMYNTITVGLLSFAYYGYPHLNYIFKDFNFISKSLIRYGFNTLFGSVVDYKIGYSPELLKRIKANTVKNKGYVAKHILQDIIIMGSFYYFQYGKPDLSNRFEEYNFINKYFANLGLVMSTDFGGSVISSIIAKPLINYFSNRREIELNNEMVQDDQSLSIQPRIVEVDHSSIPEEEPVLFNAEEVTRFTNEDQNRNNLHSRVSFSDDNQVRINRSLDNSHLIRR